MIYLDGKEYQVSYWTVSFFSYTNHFAEFVALPKLFEKQDEKLILKGNLPVGWNLGKIHVNVLFERGSLSRLFMSDIRNSATSREKVVTKFCWFVVYVLHTPRRLHKKAFISSHYPVSRHWLKPEYYVSNDPVIRADEEEWKNLLSETHLVLSKAFLALYSQHSLRDGLLTQRFSHQNLNTVVIYPLSLQLMYIFQTTSLNLLLSCWFR